MSQLPKVLRAWNALHVWASKFASCHISVHFLTSQLPKAVRTWGAFVVLTSKCASRHSGAKVLISHTTKWLRTPRFSESTFRPSGTTKHCKNTVLRDVSTFSCTLIFFLLSVFSSLIFFLLPFSSPARPTSAFPSVHIVGSWLVNFLWIWMNDRYKPLNYWTTSRINWTSNQHGGQTLGQSLAVLSTWCFVSV